MIPTQPDLLRLWKWLRNRLADGFWFHRVSRGIRWLHDHTSLGNLFKGWIRGPYAHTLPGAPEAYQAFVFLTAGTWVFFIRTPPNDAFTTGVAHCVGYTFAGYLLYELFVFLLDWLITEGMPLENYRRALATLFVSSAEVALLFSALFELQGCSTLELQPLRSAYGNWIRLLRLEHVGEETTGWCGFFAHAQWWMGLLLVGVIIASLLGPVVRPERRNR